jgi:hypothetical protein
MPLKPLLFALTLLTGLCNPVWGQSSMGEDSLVFEPMEPPFASQWYLGGTYRLDGIGSSPDNSFGLQLFHRMEKTFGTGGSVLFLPEDSSFDINLDARWIWPLPIAEPYLGAQLGYLTRSTGGVSLALRPGVMFEAPRIPLMFEVYGLVRYDVFGAVFGGDAVQNPLTIGLGASVSYRL